MDPSWKQELAAELAAHSTMELHALLATEEAAGAAVYPPAPLRFAAFDRTPFDAVRVVILGQDPYHGPDQAMGLAFSVPRGVPVPPSLRNVLRELEADLGVPAPDHGDLTAWADRGVLLLNTSLSVRAHDAGSHAGAGWEPITDAAVHALSNHRDGIAFLLWGRHAHAKAPLIDHTRHLVLEAAHPSPLSASRGFVGCRHFSRVNEWFAERGEPALDWTLPA